MAVKIVQFHVVKAQRARLSEVCGGPIYLDADVDPGDPRPSAWVQISLSDPRRPPCYKPYHRWYHWGRQYLSVKGHHNPLQKSPELIRLDGDLREVDRHIYNVVSNPWLARDSSGDKTYPLVISGATLLPAGSQYETTTESQRTFRLVNKTDSAVELDTKTDGWLSKALGAQGSVKATVKQSREVESGRRDTSAVKVNVRVPDRQTGYRAEVTFRFDFGFRFHWTADGFQWECENVAVPVEATQWHCAYLAQTPDLSACHRAFERDARDNLTPMVRQWVDDELQRLMSASNV